MTNELDLKQILEFLRSRFVLLMVSGFIGAIFALTFNVMSPKIYEAYFEFQLPRVLLSSDSQGSKSPHWVTIPAGVDARRIVMSPIKISPDVVKACGYVDTNENRKKLINQIQINTLNSSGTEMFVYVRLEGKEETKKCAEAILVNQIANSDAELAKYIKSIDSVNQEMKIIEKFAATPGIIKISSGYVYPRIYLNYVAYISIAIFIGLFLGWFYPQLKENVRG